MPGIKLYSNRQLLNPLELPPEEFFSLHNPYAQHKSDRHQRKSQQEQKQDQSDTAYYQYNLQDF